MRWQLFGVVPFIAASGDDLTRSAIARVQAESIWLPSLWCAAAVQWMPGDDSQVLAAVRIGGNTSPIELTVAPDGRLTAVRRSRWGNPPPDTKRFRVEEFGGVLEEKHPFGGYTIPSRVRVGWDFGSTRFASEGEFFRTIDDAAFR